MKVNFHIFDDGENSIDLIAESPLDSLAIEFFINAINRHETTEVKTNSNKEHSNLYIRYIPNDETKKDHN